MIKLKIEDKEYKIPTYISIGDYSKIYKIKDLFEDNYFAAKLVSIVSGAPLEDLLGDEYDKVNYTASYIMSLIPLQKPKFQDRFTLDGVDYGFIPKWQEMSFAEFVDMDTISTKKADELLDYIHYLAAIMYRPIKEEKSQHDFTIEKYNVDKMKQRAELFKNKLDVSVILGAQFFFINYARRFSTYTQISLTQKVSLWMKIKILWKMRKVIWTLIRSKKPLDGSLSSINFLETILQSTR